MHSLSKAEIAALTNLKVNGGCLLVSSIPDINEKNEFGDLIAGIGAYRKLDRKGLVIITIEEPGEDGFEFTPQVELQDEASQYLNPIYENS